MSEVLRAPVCKALKAAAERLLTLYKLLTNVLLIKRGLSVGTPLPPLCCLVLAVGCSSRAAASPPRSSRAHRGRGAPLAPLLPGRDRACSCRCLPASTHRGAVQGCLMRARLGPASGPAPRLVRQGTPGRALSLTPKSYGWLKRARDFYPKLLELPPFAAYELWFSPGFPRSLFVFVCKKKGEALGVQLWLQGAGMSHVELV